MSRLIPRRSFDLDEAVWSIGDMAYKRPAGGLVWLVSGANGENQIRAEGATQDEALKLAADQARAVGMHSR